MHAVIMAGGTSVPAAYLRMSYDRFLSFLPKENILVVTLSSYAEVLRSILPDIPKENLLLEPYARQTAPCMAFAAYTLLRRDPEAVIIAGKEPEFSVSRGLAWSGRIDAELREFREEVNTLTESSTVEKIVEQFLEDFRRYAAGERPLRAVELEKGY